MKKTLFIIGAFFLLIGAANAQTDSTMPAQPAQPANVDQWNNYDTSRYRRLPMPEPLTLEKTFPVIGKYNVTDKAGAESSVTITLDETNKGIAWVDGLPQGRIKAMLRKAPGTYKIPKQKTADDKDIAEGVLIYDKDNNTLDVCIGCEYKMEDPAAVFATANTEATDETATVETKTKTKKSTVKTKTKVTPVKTWKYSGTKVVETTAAVVPMQ